jgi:hypothetical protein
MQIATRWWLVRYGFVALHVGNEIIPPEEAKKRLYYNDGAFTVGWRPDRPTDQGPDGGLPSPVTPGCVSVCLHQDLIISQDF